MKYKKNKTKQNESKPKHNESKLLKKMDLVYNEKESNINKLLNNNKDILINIISKKENKMGIYDNNNNLLAVGEFNFYGIYQSNTNLWIWSSSIPGVSKTLIKNVNLLKKLNYLFENDDSDDINLYYQILTQDVILISEKELYKINKLLLYLSEDLMIFNPIIDDNLQFIGLKNIKEKYF